MVKVGPYCADVPKDSVKPAKRFLDSACASCSITVVAGLSIWVFLVIIQGQTAKYLPNAQALAASVGNASATMGVEDESLTKMKEGVLAWETHGDKVVHALGASATAYSLFSGLVILVWAIVLVNKCPSEMCLKFCCFMQGALSCCSILEVVSGLGALIWGWTIYYGASYEQLCDQQAFNSSSPLIPSGANVTLTNAKENCLSIMEGVQTVMGTCLAFMVIWLILSCLLAGSFARGAKASLKLNRSLEAEYEGFDKESSSSEDEDEYDNE